MYLFVGVMFDILIVFEVWLLWIVSMVTIKRSRHVPS